MIWEWIDAGLIGAGYVLGSIPTAYLVARIFKQIDIRDYGSGNVGASNVLRHVGKRAAALVILGDVGKGFLPPIVAIALDRPLEVVVTAGLAAIAGHNWSIFLRFSGGRGVATLVGAMLALGFREPVAFLAAFLVGVVIEQAAPATLAAALLATGLTIVLPTSPPVAWAWLGATGLLVLKRLLGNPPRPDQPPRRVTWRVVGNRLLFDRDVRSAAAWVGRTPGGSPGSAARATHEENDAELGHPGPGQDR